MKEAKNYWLKSAENFSKIYTAAFSPITLVKSFLDARTKFIFKFLKIKKSDKILDLGCGSGVHMVLLAARCKKIVGLDISSIMLKEARETLKKQPKKNWQLILSKAEKTGLPPNSFDKIIALGLLDYVQSPKKVLEECNRLLKKNGEILFTIPKKPSLFFFLRTSLGNQIKKLIFKLPPVDNVLNKEQVLNLTKKTGFKVNKISSLWTTMWVIKATKNAKN